MYTQEQLDGMELRELRRLARGVGVSSSELARKKPAEIIRMIKTKQKPGGVDARIKPKAAAEAKGLGRRKKQPEPEPEEEEEEELEEEELEEEEEEDTDDDDDDDDDDEEEETVAVEVLTLESLSRRIARLEMAMSSAGLMEGTHGMSAKPAEADGSVEIQKWFEQDGTLKISSDDLDRANFSTVLALNELVKQRLNVDPGVTPEMRNVPRKAKMLIARVLSRCEVVQGTDGTPKTQLVSGKGKKALPATTAAVERTETPWPPQRGYKYLFLDEETNKWFPAVCTKARGGEFSFDMKQAGTVYDMEIEEDMLAEFVKVA